MWSSRPIPLRRGGEFTQELDVYDGVVRIDARGSGVQAHLEVFIDKAADVLYVSGRSDVPVRAKATYQNWRTSRPAPEQDLFSLALEKLCDLPEEQYIAVAADLLVRAAPDGVGAAVFSPKDRDRVGAAAVAEANRRLAGKLSLSPETRNIRGGFILSRGDVEVNCTFETLVRLRKGEMSGEVAKLLFPEA